MTTFIAFSIQKPCERHCATPRNSRDHVDLMVTLKSTEIDWDDDLRKTIYQLFGVSDSATD